MPRSSSSFDGCKIIEIGISAHIVTTHVKHLYEKLEVRSRAEAVYEALQLGILKQGP